MSQKSHLNLQQLEQSRVALGNATSNRTIATLLEEVGYGEVKLQEGKALLATAQNACDTHGRQGVASTLAYSAFDQKRKELETAYRSHRKRMKIYFEDDPYQLLRLDVHTPYSTVYLVWIDSLKQFYTEATTNAEVKTALQTLKVTEQDLLATQTLVATVEGLRQTYLDEKGKLQNATTTKNQALKTLHRWMRSFYAIAGIALEDYPQLMESLSKLVKR